LATLATITTLDRGNSATFDSNIACYFDTSVHPLSVCLSVSVCLNAKCQTQGVLHSDRFGLSGSQVRIMVSKTAALWPQFLNP